MSNLTLLLPAAFSLGLTSAGHCALMCGPLSACVLGPSGGAASLAYHGARVGAYGLLGALAGALGQQATRWLSPQTMAHVSWIAAALLALSALGITKSVGGLPGAGLLGRALRLAARGPTTQALALGALTALLPCGVLAGALLVAIAAAEAPLGAASMVVFGLGTAPLLLAGQLGWGALAQSRLSPLLPPLRRGALLLSAAILVYRGWSMAQGQACH